ncbi:MAG: DNA repair protein RecO [Verrucomicrobiales bacterium]
MRGILLRRHLYRDTSMVLVWLTVEHGKIKMLAHGIRKPGNPFHGQTEIFCESDITISYSQRGGVHRLKEALMSKDRRVLANNLLRMRLAAYFCLLMEGQLEEEEPSQECFDLLTRALDYLVRQQPRVKALHHYEQELAILLGFWEPESGRTVIEALGSHGAKLPESRASLLKELPG